MSTFHVGGIEITRVEEMLSPGSPPGYLFADFKPSFYEENPELATPAFLDPKTQRLMSSMHTWVVRNGQDVILIDTGCGNDKPRPPAFRRFDMLDIPFLDRLAAAGVTPDDVTLVVNTHFHVDHVGWNTRLEDGRWVPTFPKARYLFPKAEYDHWIASDAGLKGFPDCACLLEDSVMPIYDAGLVDHIADGDEISAGLTVSAAPGHTAGQVVLTARSNGETGIFSADVLHQIVQVPRPEWHCRFDEDSQLAYRTRKALLERCIAEDALVFPAHFGAPHASRLAPRGTGYRLVI
ncbi:MBL fold metallo-hydrolase [Aquabacter sp. CN5-332]|uniref:MBL fold metallo-hydrolase n=1 Tax=Aquabacter sp. CN5-332 TaxID=3156608 RepID=UPI0032B33DE0